MGKWVIRLCILVVPAASAVSVLADTLVTRSGSRHEGEVTEKGEGYVLIKPSGGRMFFPASMVREVIKQKPASPATRPAGGAVGPPPPDVLPKPGSPGKRQGPLGRPDRVLNVGKVERERRVVFSSQFENATGQEQYDPAAAGLGDMIALLLGQQANIEVVERQRLAALTAEQARALKGITGTAYALRAGKLLQADTVLTGRLFLIKDKLTVNVKAIDIERELIVASDQVSCRPTYLMEAAMQLADKLAKQMALPLGKIDLKEIDPSPIAALHFAKALSHYYAGNMDGAIMQFMRSIDIDPNYQEAHYFSGMCYYHLQEHAHAVIEWEKFLEADPGSPYAPQARHLLAQARQRVKDSPVQPLAPRGGTAPGDPSRPEGGLP